MSARLLSNVGPEIFHMIAIVRPFSLGSAVTMTIRAGFVLEAFACEPTPAKPGVGGPGTSAAA
jgi:hypothetical protein